MADESRQDRLGGEPEEMRFGQMLSRIQEIVERIEAGSLDLEESLRLFEEGMSLVRRADRVLREAEARVEQLVAGADGVDTEPFPGDEVGDVEA